MHISETTRFIHVHTPCYAIALAKDRPFIGYLGVESGARKRGHQDFNLLRPGPGGVILPNDDRPATGSAQRESAAVAYEQVMYEGGRCACRVEFVDDRAFVVRLKAIEGDLPAELLRIAFAPSRSPMSFWAIPRDWRGPRQPCNWDLMEPSVCEADFNLPGLATFPDYGTMRIDCDADAVRVTERMVPDPANTGLNLGLGNAGHHNVRTALHHGHFDLCFVAERPVREVVITFRVEEEKYPQIAGCDFSGDRWAGLRRLWMNSFTLSPMSLTMGDNPILPGTGHLSIHWKSDMAVYTPPLVEGVRVIDFVRNSLERTFTEFTDADGRMDGYGWENGACNLIALHDYLLASGDWAFVQRHLPTVKKVIEYNLSLDADGDGLLEAAYHGNHFRDEKTSLNWWDAFAFGHKDAYGNLVFHQAFRRIRPVLTKLGESALVERLDAFLAAFRQSFHRTFYNPETGVYAGWVSRDGRMHDYMFTFIAAMAINERLIEGEPARQMLQRLLDALERGGYGEFRYGVPGPAIPVDPDDRTTWGPMADWGQYENGGFCGQTAYHFILALYRVGMREQADRILFNMLKTFDELPTHSGLNPGFTQSVDWRNRDGHPCGYNYLADNYVFLLAAVEGYFGVERAELPAD